MPVSETTSQSISYFILLSYFTLFIIIYLLLLFILFIITLLHYYAHGRGWGVRLLNNIAISAIVLALFCTRKGQYLHNVRYPSNPSNLVPPTQGVFWWLENELALCRLPIGSPKYLSPMWMVVVSLLIPSTVRTRADGPDLRSAILSLNFSQPNLAWNYFWQ